MAIVTLTPDRIVRDNVQYYDLVKFHQDRETLIAAGFETTAWVDYFHAFIDDEDGGTHYFVTIRKNDFLVESHYTRWTTKDIQRVINILVGK